MKKFIAIIFTAGIILTSVLLVTADEESTDGVDIMLLIDKSTSMGEHDPHLETLAATRHILNLSLGTGNRVGYVVYNDTIIAYQGLQTIETVEEIDHIMSRLSAIQISRATDVGLALQKARRQLIFDGYRHGRTAMILLSDGDYELITMHYNPNRSQFHVSADVEDVLTTVSYPIFTIQYSVLEYPNQAPQREWGQRTGGANFNVMTPAEMIDAVNEVYQLIIERAEPYIRQQLYEANRLHEHQLMIQIPSTQTKRSELVEVTLIGNGLIQEVITPMGHEYIIANLVDGNYIITITNPIQESYTLYYLTVSEEPFATNTHVHLVDRNLLDQTPIEETIPRGEDIEEMEEAIPLQDVVLGLTGIAALGLLIFRRVKK